MNTTSYIQYAAAVVIGFIIGAGIMSLWNVSRKPATLGTLDGRNGMATTTIPTSNASSTDVVVQNQKAGSKVMVQSVTLPGIGWVAVHEYNADGKLGNVLGATMRDVGPSQDVEVKLLRPMIAGKNYAVVLYVDNGNRAFERRKDTSLKDSAGNETEHQFKAE